MFQCPANLYSWIQLFQSWTFHIVSMNFSHSFHRIQLMFSDLFPTVNNLFRIDFGSVHSCPSFAGNPSANSAILLELFVDIIPFSSMLIRTHLIWENITAHTWISYLWHTISDSMHKIAFPTCVSMASVCVSSLGCAFRHGALEFRTFLLLSIAFVACLRSAVVSVGPK